MLTELKIVPLSTETKEDFYRVHADGVCGGWCFCSAWWVPTWEGFNERTSQQNRALREELFANQTFDGYIVYINGEPQGWCQVGRRDQFTKLVNQFNLEPDENTWAITCMALPPRYQGLGLAHEILGLIIADLKASGVKRIQAFPKFAPDLPKDEIWTGPLTIFEKAGFKYVTKDERRYVMELIM